MRIGFLVEKHDGLNLAVDHIFDNFSPASLNLTKLDVIIQFPLIILVSEKRHIVIAEKTDQTTKLVHSCLGVEWCDMIKIVNFKEIWDWKIKLEEIILENMVSLARVPSQVQWYYFRWLTFKPHYCLSIFLIAWTANWHCRYLYCDYKATKIQLTKDSLTFLIKASLISSMFSSLFRLSIISSM